MAGAITGNVITIRRQGGGIKQMLRKVDFKQITLVSPEGGGD
jgi:hypothetical protein